MKVLCIHNMYNIIVIIAIEYNYSVGYFIKRVVHKITKMYGSPYYLCNLFINLIN